MTHDDVLKLFKERGALLQGHFKLTSGLHSDTYLQCALLFQYGCDADRLGAELAKAFKGGEKPPTVVISPAVGGIVLGYTIARALGARAMFAERVEGRFTLRRGFAIIPGENVVIAEDVMTTGGSVLEIAELVQNLGGSIAGFAAVADRSEGELRLPSPKKTLLRLPLVTYTQDQCPMCEEGTPLVKPGSRPDLPAGRQESVKK